MTNPLRNANLPVISAPKDEADRRRHWIERGNRLLWGQEPDRNGTYFTPRPDLHWVCINDHYVIEPRR